MGLLYSKYVANPTINTNINAVSGTLQKTLRNSFFKRFHMNSTMADYVFDTQKLGQYSKEIVVLQIMLCGEKEFLMEAIYKEDYDKIFNILESKGE